MTNPFSYGPLAPPGVLITLCLIGAWLALYRRRLGLLVMLLSSSFLYAASTRVTASYLLSKVEAKLPADPDFSAAKAIVVLGGGVRYGAGGEPDALGPDTLERVDFAARAWHRLHLPILVSGGIVQGSKATVAGLMKATLENDFGVPVTWTEDRSDTTWENALYSARLLKAAGIDTVALVTHSSHMPRALWAFEEVGLHPIPWPAPRDRLRAGRMRDYLPDLAALQDTGSALHELVGKAWYRLHYAKPVSPPETPAAAR